MPDFNVKRPSRKILLGLLGLVVLLLLVFEAGLSIGYEKAMFSAAWGKNYFTNFVGEKGQVVRGAPFVPRDPNVMFVHGLSGQVLTNTVVNLNNQEDLISIRDSDGLEEPVETDSNTYVRYLDTDLMPKDIQPLDFVVVLGGPSENGRIEARFIRVTGRGAIASTTFVQATSSHSISK